MSKEAVFYGIGAAAAAALTAFFCAIPHESRGCFCATVFLSLLHPLLTSLKSLFYKALGALSAVRANLAPSDLVPQDNSSFCLRRNNRPPPASRAPSTEVCGAADVDSATHLATFLTCG